MLAVVALRATKNDKQVKQLGDGGNCRYLQRLIWLIGSWSRIQRPYYPLLRFFSSIPVSSKRLAFGKSRIRGTGQHLAIVNKITASYPCNAPGTICLLPNITLN